MTKTMAADTMATTMTGAQNIAMATEAMAAMVAETTMAVEVTMAGDHASQRNLSQSLSPSLNPPNPKRKKPLSSARRLRNLRRRRSAESQRERDADARSLRRSAESQREKRERREREDAIMTMMLTTTEAVMIAVTTERKQVRFEF